MNVRYSHFQLDDSATHNLHQMRVFSANAGSRVTCSKAETDAGTAVIHCEQDLALQPEAPR